MVPLGAAILLATMTLRGLAAPSESPSQAGSGADTPAIREPMPSAASLAPVDTEAFRERYGTMGLFRLRLGVDAAATPAAKDAAPLPCPPPPWSESTEHEAFTKALAASRFHDAGKALGRWRRWSAACGGAGIQGTGGL